MWEAIQDATLIMLIIAAFISLILSFIPSGEDSKYGPMLQIRDATIFRIFFVLISGHF